jgi:iron complex outermembrane receptor protein
VIVIGESSLPAFDIQGNQAGVVLSTEPMSETPVAQGDPSPIPTPTPTDAPPLVQSTPQPQVPELELGEITVSADRPDRYHPSNASSATRTDTPILDTPQAIQVVPRQVLEDQQITRIDEALRNVSGVVGKLETFGESTSLVLRGFSTDSFTLGPIFRDGYRNSENLAVQETANVERIEVLKGPASVLYGQTDPGGVINLVTKQPLEDPYYSFNLQAGSFGFFRPTIDLSGPLDAQGNILYRLNLAYQQEKGFRQFDTESERYFLAPIITWKLGERTDLSIFGEYLTDTAPYDFGLVAFGDGLANIPFDRILNEPDDVLKTNSLTLGYSLQHQFNNEWALSHGFRYVNQGHDFPKATLLLSLDEETGLLTRAYGARQYQADEYSLQTYVTGKIETGVAKHTLLMGFDLNWDIFNDVFSKIDFDNPTVIDIFNPVYGQVPRPDFNSQPQIFPEFDTESEGLGVYFQDQVSFNDQLILVGSLRYDSYNFRNVVDQDSRDEQALIPRIALLYKSSENLSLYANYSESLKPVPVLNSSGDFLAPEESQGYEMGIKGEFFRGKLLATLAYFDITKQNVATADPIVMGASVATGEQRSQGIEFDVSGEILPGWNIIANYAYIDAKVTKDNVIAVGNRLQGSPYHSGGLWTTYKVQSGDLQGWSLGLGFNYVGQRFGDRENTFKVDSYFVTNAAIAYQKDNWKFTLNLDNLFDVKYIEGVSGFNRISGISPGEPFTIKGSVGVEF